MCFRQFAEPDFYLIFLQNYLSNNEFSSFFPPDYLIISGINQVIRLKVAYVFTCYLGCFVIYQVKIRLLLRYELRIMNYQISYSIIQLFSYYSRVNQYVKERLLSEL